MIFRAFIVSLLVVVSLHAKEINLDKALEQATAQNKHLFVFLHKTDCGYCESMIQFTFTDSDIEAFLQEHFVYEHINVTNNETVSYRGFKGNGQAFAKHIGYDFYPTSIFFDEEGEHAYVEVGYIDPKHLPNEVRFMKILKYVQSKSYQTKEFDVSN